VGGRRAAAALVAVVAMTSASTAGNAEAPNGRLRFADLPGWTQDAHDETFAVFRRSCERVIATLPGRSSGGRPVTPALRAVCQRALDGSDAPSRAEARAFFERHFRPIELRPTGRLTGYFEPEYDASPVAEGPFRTPVLARPHDLVPLEPGQAVGPLSGLAAARVTSSGALEPYFDRAAIEDGALADRGLELVYLAEPFDLFLAQIQGSFRVRLPDGRKLRLGYAARNGHLFSPISRALMARGLLSGPIDLPAIRAALASAPDVAREVMRLNRSYVFFRRIDDLPPEAGPIGAQGLPLTTRRSIAVDRTRHAYGTPIYLDAEGADRDGTPLRRLTIAQDTGTAIVGPARIDFFTGSGAAAGDHAGAINHPVRVIVLRPVATDTP
jgi:membrane-bound lytic murein transglycosylase A